MAQLSDLHGRRRATETGRDPQQPAGAPSTRSRIEEDEEARRSSKGVQAAGECVGSSRGCDGTGEPSYGTTGFPRRELEDGAAGDASPLFSAAPDRRHPTRQGQTARRERSFTHALRVRRKAAFTASVGQNGGAMSYLAELMVAQYLTAGGRVFLSPQFHIPYDKEFGDGGSHPDFVAVDIFTKDAAVVEVSTAYDMTNLFSRLKQREHNWIAPLKRHFKVCFGEKWSGSIRVLCFVRRDRLEDCARRNFGADVDFYAIETASFAWDYWKDREGIGLPPSISG